MIEFIITTLITAVGFIVGAYVLPGVKVKDFTAAIIVAIAVAVLNGTIGRVFEFLTLGLLGWGVISFLLTAVMIRIADYFLDDFETDGYITALLLAIVIAAVNVVIRWLPLI